MENILINSTNLYYSIYFLKKKIEPVQTSVN